VLKHVTDAKMRKFGRCDDIDLKRVQMVDHRGFPEVVPLADPGVVDEHRERPPGLGRRLEQSVGRTRKREIGLNRFHPHAVAILKFGGECLKPFNSPRRNHQVGAPLRQLIRKLLTDAA
jgi:hypothetical protein